MLIATATGGQSSNAATTSTYGTIRRFELGDGSFWKKGDVRESDKLSSAESATKEFQPIFNGI
jgi:hypothetical protein